MGRVFANGLGDLGSISGHVIPKPFKMVFDTSLINTQQYKIRIKSRIEPSPISRCSSYWKGSPLNALECGCQLYLLLCHHHKQIISQYVSPWPNDFPINFLFVCHHVIQRRPTNYPSVCQLMTYILLTNVLSVCHHMILGRPTNYLYISPWPKDNLWLADQQELIYISSGGTFHGIWRTGREW